jgi:outer membrane protein
MPCPNLHSIFPLLILALVFVAAPAPAQLPQARIGMVFDRPLNQPQKSLVTLFERQLTELTRGDFDIHFPTELRLFADGSIDGVKSAVDQLLADARVDLLIAVGPLAAHTVGRQGPLPKPVVAPLVFSPQIQGIPQNGNSSGSPNLNYLTFPADIRKDLEKSRSLAPFKRVALLFDRPLGEAMPDLWNYYVQEAAALGIQATLVPIDTDADKILQRLPADTEAVFSAFPLSLSPIEFERLSQGLIKRHLPSFSNLGLEQVQNGLLAALHPATDSERLVRQVALNVQRILLGEDAAALPVFFERRDRLTINMRTARAIGLSPSWALLTEAELLHRNRTEITRSLDLQKTVRQALEADLDLQANRRALEAGAKDITRARATLLPQVDLSATGIILDKDIASAVQPQRSLTGKIGLSQVLYSDGARANLAIQGHTQEGRRQDHRRLRLDLIQRAATTYLNVLRAKTFEKVQKENLELSAANLELAQVRQAIGASGRADVYRWESQIATARRDLIAANAQRNLAEMDLNRLLRRPLEEAFSTTETGLFDEGLVTRNERFRRYMDNPHNFRVMRDFMVEDGLANAPELRRLDSALAAAERGLNTTRRALFSPTLALQGEYGSEFYDSGVGSAVPLDENNWNLGLNLAFPLYSGGDKLAARGQAQAQLEELHLRRQAAAESLEQRIRSALHLAGASYAGISLIADASVAAGRNLQLVKDAYGRGAVSILGLLDAQNAAILAEEGAANAVYDFLIDLIEVERAIGKFYLQGSPQERRDWFDRLEAFFAARP